MKKLKSVVMLAAVGAAAAIGVANAQAPNGIGPDPDGDSNPATNTRLFARIGDAAEAALDPPFQIVTFEAVRKAHGKPIAEEKVGARVVKFSRGLKRQICKGQLYFRYDTQCTYLAAPSGEMAALYDDPWGRPLRIRFEQPVCAAALALYPTGGREGEEYKVTLQPYGADEKALTAQSYKFNWTNDTFRWRLMAGAYFLNEKAKRVDVNIASVTNPKKVVRFLIDDVAFVEDGCTVHLADVNAEAGGSALAPLPPPPAPAPTVVLAPPSPSLATTSSPPAQPAPLPPAPPAQPEPPKISAFFDTNGAIDGVSVAMTDDRCVASVIFDNASLGGDGPGAKDLAFTLPLRIIGGPAEVTVEARGFVSSAAPAGVALSVDGQRRALVDVPEATDYAFSSSDHLEGIADAGVFRVELTMAEPSGEDAAAAILALDSLDFTLTNCSR
jgi:hypothetical protein